MSDIDAIKQGQSANDARVVAFFAAHGVSATPREDVFTYRAWKEQGRQVAAGECGCKIGVMVEFEDKEKEITSKGRKTVSVFHISQTVPLGEAKGPDRKPVIATDNEDAPTDSPNTPEPSDLSDRLRLAFDSTITKADRELAKPRIINTRRRMDIARSIVERNERSKLAANIGLKILEAEGAKLFSDLGLHYGGEAIGTLLSMLSGYKLDNPLGVAFLAAQSGVKPETDKGELLRLEANTVGAGVDFFETREWLADILALHVPAGMVEVLEPGVGKGSLINAIRKANPLASIYGLEISSSLCEYSKARFAGDANVSIEQSDFMTHEFGFQFDAAIMNPPFSNDDMHVYRAWSMLNPGGRLAAIVGSSIINNSDKRSKAFQSWVAEHTLMPIPVSELGSEKAFEGTQANAYLIVGIKP
jgi:methylase of polypeptide subunit release factors